MIRPLLLLFTCPLLSQGQESGLQPPAHHTKAPVTDALEAAGDPAPETTPPTDRHNHAATLELPADRDEVVRLQIFLDQCQFGPGFIDGNAGTFTRLAMENYNISRGRAGQDRTVMRESLEAVSSIYATAIVPDCMDRFVDPTLPDKKTLQAKRPFMPYRSIGEFMAERYHTSVDLLIQLNGSDAVLHAKAGSPILVPNVKPFCIETLQPGKSYHPDKAMGLRQVVVDTGKKQAYIYQQGLPNPGGALTKRTNPLQPAKPRPQLVASFPITPGEAGSIPKGMWHMKNSVELPEWRYDPLLLDTGKRGPDSLTIPAGPNNPVGVIWNGLTKSGIGIHGTDNPRTIGRASSAGCIRMANWDAARIPELVRPGAVVWIK